MAPLWPIDALLHPSERIRHICQTIPIYRPFLIPLPHHAPDQSHTVPRPLTLADRLRGPLSALALCFPEPGFSEPSDTSAGLGFRFLRAGEASSTRDGSGFVARLVRFGNGSGVFVFAALEGLILGGVGSSSLGSASLDLGVAPFLDLPLAFFLLGFGSSVFATVSSWVSCASSCSSVLPSGTSTATGPVFFCTLGTTALVRPPTVKNVILAPLASCRGSSFLPLPHRCLNSQESGNLLESARVETASEVT